MGQPDNDFLVYLPVRDMWRKRLPRKDGKPWNLGEDLLMQFDIHSMDEKAPEFIRSILTIDSLGYDCDYISDRQLGKVRIENGMLMTEGGTRYKALIIPSGTTIDDRLKALLTPLSAYIIYGEDATAMAHYAKAEPLRTDLKLRAIRRTNSDGHHYFITNLTPSDVCQETTLAVPCQSATWYDPMTGDIIPAAVKDGKVLVNLRSGESRILVVSPEAKATSSALTFPRNTETAHQPTSIALAGPWTLTFTEEAPKVNQTFKLDKLQTWETLSPEATITMGTGIYTTTFRLTKQQAKQRWLLDLGDVRESARVYLNDQFLGCAWAVPYILDCRNALKKGRNELRIEVTNLPANRISDLDRKGVKWRKMKEINVVNINYQKTTYADWTPMPSGLNSEVKLILR